MGISRSQQFELQFQRDNALNAASAIIRNSPPVLGEKIAWIRNVFDEDWRRSILLRYQVAALILEIYNDVNENNGAVYGAKAVEAIKHSFGWDNGVIYHALHVAEAFTPEQIEAITAMRCPGGKPLSYSHVVALANVEDESKRDKLLKQAVKGGWTSKKLANAVDLSAVPQPGKREDRRGRPLGRPKTFDAVLDQQAHFVEDFLNRNDQVWSNSEHSLSAKAEELNTPDFTQERAARLRRHADQMNLLAQKAQERASEAMRVHQLFEQILEQQAGQHKKLVLAAPTSAPTDSPA